MTNEIFAVKQLPIIEEQLRSLKTGIEMQVAEATAMVCTEETYKMVKKDRAALSKQFKELEERRKEVKAAIMAPYDQFEELYKECVTMPFTEADRTLKARVDEVEGQLKADKEAQVVKWFDEYRGNVGLTDDWLSFDRTGITVGMSDSLRSLKVKAKAWVDKILEDLAAIAAQEHKDEIFVEYKSTLNVSTAMTTVANRHKAMEEERQRREAINERMRARAAAEEAAKAVVAEEQKAEKAETITAPTTVQLQENVELNMPEVSVPEPQATPGEKKYSMTFRVYGTIEQLRAVKRFLEEGGYQYE